MSEQEPTNGIYAALAAVNREIDAIGKNSRNQHHNFNFRGIDDAYNTLHDILARNGVITVPRVLSHEQVERVNATGKALFWTVMKVEYDFIHEDGSQITGGPVIGEAMDTGDKGANKALAIAHKYVLFQTFTIPTLFTDPDSESHDVKPNDPLATQEQKDEIKDLWDYIGKRHQSWVRNNHDRMTTRHAESIINDGKEQYAREQSEQEADEKAMDKAEKPAKKPKAKADTREDV